MLSSEHPAQAVTRKIIGGAIYWTDTEKDEAWFTLEGRSDERCYLSSGRSPEGRGGARTGGFCGAVPGYPVRPFYETLKPAVFGGTPKLSRSKPLDSPMS